MNAFKERWEIQNNWQLFFPFLGIVGLVYSAYAIARKILSAFINNSDNNLLYYILLAVGIGVFFFIMLRFFLWCFKKLENKWVTNYRWEIITIFIVFALTGTSSLRIARPFLEWFGFTRTLFADGFFGGFFYWIVRIIIILPLYQILLIIFGTLLGQFKFFWEFEKKMLKRMKIIK
ncbi:hypothetical protein IMCC3317_09060 [Kordia antarctica]|uniref:DUF6787 domain-containing protein n=1 Tax=Kordia antarctica TaxID=1218801 RepID=A0A7L4ZGA7_9FLAO|nr:DUF6787 family protein [Kordia antarctica]QHI35560.1 hypothetical protein IMCC3317_09060 [Kordia antarctica]